MQFSIEVLPAPFGPMMARISPLRMSNDTSLKAFTPPKPRDTFSTASSASPLVTTGESGALMRLRFAFRSRNAVLLLEGTDSTTRCEQAECKSDPLGLLLVDACPIQVG